MSQNIIFSVQSTFLPSLELDPGNSIDHSIGRKALRDTGCIAFEQTNNWGNDCPGCDRWPMTDAYSYALFKLYTRPSDKQFGANQNINDNRT